MASLRDRLFQLYGERPDLVPVERSYGEVRVHGYVAALAAEGPTRGPQHVFVNRRMVKDRTIAHAILDAYSVASIKERSPEVHLFIEMPLDAVDVNVHPTKAEVRFRDQSFMHQVVRRAVGDALGEARCRSCRACPAAGAGDALGFDRAAAGGVSDDVPEPLDWAGAIGAGGPGEASGQVGKALRRRERSRRCARRCTPRSRAAAAGEADSWPARSAASAR